MKRVLFKNHFLSCRRALRLEEGFCIVRPLVPRLEGPDDAFHVSNRFDPLGMPLRSRESNRGAPVMNHQDHVVFDANCIEPGIYITLVISVTVKTRLVPRLSNPCQHSQGQGNGQTEANEE
jgi:hypothetical protein